MRQTIAAFAVALTLVVTACGTTGDGDSAESSTTTTPTTDTSETTESTESTTTEPAVDEAAQARAESIDVTADDFPADWETSPHEDSGEPDLFTTCSEFDLDELSQAEYFTDDFSTGELSADDGQRITIGTRVFEDEDTASSIVDVMPTDEFIACANDELQSNFGDDYISGEVEARQFEGIGDQTEGFSGVVEVTSQGSQVPVQIAFVAIRTGDLITGISALGVGQDLDTDVLDDLGDRIVELQEAA